MSKNEGEKLKPNQKEHKDLLDLLVGGKDLTAEELRSLVAAMDNLDVIAKVHLLEGVPFVFAKSPMKYLIFREQVADRFSVGYQDVCIVGSAKLGFSPSPHKYGRPFSETSDVDVVIISNEMFDEGTHELFEYINNVGPLISFDRKEAVTITARDWRLHKDAVRNYVFENFNPGLLPASSRLRSEIFASISSTSALFLALEPQVFVSKIRCRIFRHWRSAESYYINTLRKLKDSFKQENNAAERDIGDDDEDIDEAENQPAPAADARETKVSGA